MIWSQLDVCWRFHIGSRLLLAQDGYVASPAFGPCSGCVGSLALRLQYPVKQAGHSPLSVLLVLVELAELGHCTEQVPYTPSLLIGQLYHSVKLRHKHILFTYCLQITVNIHHRFIIVFLRTGLTH